MPATPYKDEPGIADAEKLWRRTCPMWVIPDDNHGGWTVSSAASDASSDGSPLSMSSSPVWHTRRDAGPTT